MIVEKGEGLQTYSDGTFFIKSPRGGNVAVCGETGLLWERCGRMWSIWRKKWGKVQKSGGVSGENGGVGRKKSAKCTDWESECSQVAGRGKEGEKSGEAWKVGEEIGA